MLNSTISFFTRPPNLWIILTLSYDLTDTWFNRFGTIFRSWLWTIFAVLINFSTIINLITRSCRTSHGLWNIMINDLLMLLVLLRLFSLIHHNWYGTVFYYLNNGIYFLLQRYWCTKTRHVNTELKLKPWRWWTDWSSMDIIRVIQINLDAYQFPCRPNTI